MLKITGEGGAAKVRKFLSADLGGGYSFHAEAGSGLPRTRAGRMARIDQLLQMQMARPDQVWKHVELADLSGVQKYYSSEEELITREHDALLEGRPINMVEVTRAAQAAQNGINIYTGQKLQSQEEAQQVISDASVMPLTHENSIMHIDGHGLKMKSIEYEGYPIEVQMRFQRHYELTKNKLQSEATKDPRSAPRTSLSLHGTVGPTIASKILGENNISASPEEFMEPPLETLVIDSVDKMDQDEAGNDPLTDIERELALQQSAMDAQLKSAKMTHEIELARQRATSAANQNSSPLDEIAKAQSIKQQDEAHTQDMLHKEILLNEKVATSRAQRRKQRNGATRKA